MKEMSHRTSRSNLPHRAFAGTFSILFAFGLVFLYLYTLRYHLQFFYPWIEIPLHILGGMVVGAVSHYITITAEGDDRNICQSPRPYILSIFLSAFVVGIMWELYEVMMGYAESLNTINTLSDLFFDLLGASSIALWVTFSMKRQCKDQEDLNKKDVQSVS